MRIQFNFLQSHNLKLINKFYQNQICDTSKVVIWHNYGAHDNGFLEICNDGLVWQLLK